MQVATVQRGDLVRDISVQGRILAANAPTLYSQEIGQVQLFKQPGEAVFVGMQSDAERAELAAQGQTFYQGDQGQLHQVLLTLLKNAHESGSRCQH